MNPDPLVTVRILTAAQAPPPPTTTTTVPDGGPVGRFLTDPAGHMRALRDRVVGALSGFAADVVPWALRLAVAVAVLSVALALYRRLRPRPPGALVEVAAPPETDPAGALALWRHLHSVLVPRGLRGLWHRPHVGFQLAWAAGRLHVGLWVPPEVHAPAVARAVEGAWPGARATVAEACPPLPPGARVRGGEARLAFPEWFPLAVDTRTDQYRALLGAAGDLDAGETAVVQVLARPARNRKLRRARGRVDALRHGRPTGLAAVLQQVNRPMEPLPTRTGPADPFALADSNTARDKLTAHPHFESVVRWAVAGPRESNRRRLRGRARELSAAFGAWSGRNRLRVRRRRGAARLVAGYRIGGGDLLNLDELASLAHLPHDGPGVAGWGRAGGRSLAPIPELFADDDEGDEGRWRRGR